MEEKFDRRRFAVFSVLAVCWMGVIFLFSSQNGEISGELSHGVLERLLQLFGIDSGSILAETAQIIHLWIRKSAHFFIYMVLSLLLSNAFLAVPWKNRYRILLTVLLSVLYAVTDELHQYFVPGRTASFRDVCIDTLGAVLGFVFVYGTSFIVRKFQTRH